MTEHVHEWKPDIYEKAYLGARCDCGETLSEVEVTRLLNATERLSAERVKNILEDRKLYSQDVLALHEYANILEGK